MAKTVIIKLTKAGPGSGPFDITTEYGDVVASGVPKKALIKGISYHVDDNVKMLTIASTGKCGVSKTFSLESFTIIDYAEAEYKQAMTACLWTHLKNPGL